MTAATNLKLRLQQKRRRRFKLERTGKTYLSTPHAANRDQTPSGPLGGLDALLLYLRIISQIIKLACVYRF